MSLGVSPCRAFPLVVWFLWLCLVSLILYLVQNQEVSRDINKVNTKFDPNFTTSESTKPQDYNWESEEDPLVDKKTKTWYELVSEATRDIRSLPPYPFILGNDENGPSKKNASCAPFPEIFDLKFSSTYWQTLRTPNGTLYLYGAYYDMRALNPLGPSIRILTMIDVFEPNITTHCQLWFEKERAPVFSKVLQYEHIWIKGWKDYVTALYQPYLLTCIVPESHMNKVPTSVSIVTEPCNPASNNLRVQFDKPEKKKDFAVCVKGLNFIHKDISVRLVEWIELLGILGADKIFFYELSVHANTSKVLLHYKEKGLIDVTPLTVVGDVSNDPRIRYGYLRVKNSQRRLNEMIPYNDCLYRNLYKYKYIALLDIDEVIMPLKANSWTSMMQDVERASNRQNKTFSSFSFRNAYFFDSDNGDHKWLSDAPQYLHMLQHVYRSRNHTALLDYPKCFHDPGAVLTLHNHFPFKCLNGPCSPYHVGTEVAQLQHYRESCAHGIKNCTEFRETQILDANIWRFKEELIQRTTSALRTLGFI